MRVGVGIMIVMLIMTIVTIRMNYVVFLCWWRYPRSSSYTMTITFIAISGTVRGRAKKMKKKTYNVLA